MAVVREVSGDSGIVNYVVMAVTMVISRILEKW